MSEALDRMPGDLTADHRTVARVLLGRPEGVRRDQVKALSGFDDRKFRQLVSEIATSGWLPTLSERTPDGGRVYRIAQATESDTVNQANAEDYKRAISLHQRSRGRLQAFQAHHQAGGLFLDGVPELEAT